MSVLRHRQTSPPDASLPSTVELTDVKPEELFGGERRRQQQTSANKERSTKGHVIPKVSGFGSEFVLGFQIQVLVFRFQSWIASPSWRFGHLGSDGEFVLELFTERFGAGIADVEQPRRFPRGAD